jgi:hypothetical protein
MQRRPQGRRVRKTNVSIFTALSHPVKPPADDRLWPKPFLLFPLCLCGEESFPQRRRIYPSFALIEIFAFSTFDTGHPFSAASAYF